MNQTKWLNMKLKNSFLPLFRKIGLLKWNTTATNYVTIIPEHLGYADDKNMALLTRSQNSLPNPIMHSDQNEGSVLYNHSFTQTENQFSYLEMPGMFTALLGTVLKQNFTKTCVLVNFLFLISQKCIKSTTGISFSEEGNYPSKSPQLTETVVV